MIRNTDKVNEIYALARKRARLDLAGIALTQAEYRQREAEITGEILDGILAGLHSEVEGAQR
jgi:hypothetical protein